MFHQGRTIRAKLLSETLDLQSPPAAFLDALAEREDPVFLDSSALGESFGRYSILTCTPLETLSITDGVMTDSSGRAVAAGNEQVWGMLKNAFEFVNAEDGGSEIEYPYVPGWFGYFGYEMNRCIERVPQHAVRDTPFPDLRLGFYDAILVYDAVERKWVLTELSFDSPPPNTGRTASALRRIAALTCAPTESGYPVPVESAAPGALPLRKAQSNFTPDEYRSAVEKCTEYIAAGDIFQVNLSQRFTVTDAPSPLVIYHHLRRRNPAWYACYLQFRSGGDECSVVSCSPELFLRVRGDRVITRPIKGTRKRVGDGPVDNAAAAELLKSPKDNAELAMIVDLLRNDLGRVCRFGTVRVTEPVRLETHPTVFHLVGTVEGRIRRGSGMAELMRAVFPGGSITGAPKIRAMEIIDELEPSARGVYTGAIGYVGVNGASEWNIAIRTILCHNRTAHVQVGGGIVADSTPEGEYLETLDKGRAMLEAIAAATRTVKT
jgi:para-aminobenzoate synthetase component 1